jgi:hypothetical protein
MTLLKANKNNKKIKNKHHLRQLNVAGIGLPSTRGEAWQW